MVLTSIGGNVTGTIYEDRQAIKGSVLVEAASRNGEVVLTIMSALGEPSRAHMQIRFSPEQATALADMLVRGAEYEYRD